MTRSRNRRLVATLFASAALALTAVPALAVTPTVETFSVQREVPFEDCPGFATVYDAVVPQPKGASRSGSRAATV